MPILTKPFFIPKYGFCVNVENYELDSTILLYPTELNVNETFSVFVTDPYRKSHASLAFSSQNGDMMKGKSY